MKAFELPVKVTPEGKLELPPALLKLLSGNQVARILILISEPQDKEEIAWYHLTAEQFFTGYEEGDAVYDRI